MENSDAMPLPMILMIVSFFALVVAIAIVVSIASTRNHRPIAQERERAKRLATGGLRIEGRVTAWATYRGGTEEAPSMRLRVQFPFSTSQHDAELVTCIDRGLLTGFAPGSRIHLLVDPENPDQVAVDRSANAVELPRSWQHST